MHRSHHKDQELFEWDLHTIPGDGGGHGSGLGVQGGGHDGEKKMNEKAEGILLAVLMWLLGLLALGGLLITFGAFIGYLFRCLSIGWAWALA